MPSFPTDHRYAIPVSPPSPTLEVLLAGSGQRRRASAVPGMIEVEGFYGLQQDITLRSMVLCRKNGCAEGGSSNFVLCRL